MKRSPYQSRQKQNSNIIPVGSYDKGGVVYLKKIDAVTPADNPIDYQEATKRQSQTTILFLQAVKNCAEKYGISQQAARERIFPGDPLPSANIQDFLEIGQISKLNSLHYEAVENAKTLLDCDEDSAKERIFQTARATGESVEVTDLKDFLSEAQLSILDSLQSVAIENCIARLKITASEARRQFYEKAKAEVADDLYDHLTPEQAGSLVSMQDNARKIKLEAATLFLRYRLAYPVVITEDADTRAGLIKIQPLTFPVAVGNLFRFGDVTIEADDAVGYDSEQLPVKPLPRKILAGEVGFLMDVLTGIERFGSADWTQQHTMEYLTENQIEGIYQFYLQESGQGTEEKTVAAIAGSEDENLNLMLTTKSAESQNTLAATVSIGEASSGNSNAQESTTIDSTATTSEVNLIG